MSNPPVILRVVEECEPDGSRGHLREVPCDDGGIRVARSLRDLTPYETVSSQAALDARRGRQPIFKLDWNESTIGPSPRVDEAIRQYLREGDGLNFYPTLGSRNLLQALEGYTRISRDHLLVTNGSDDGLHLICSTYLDPGDEVVVPVPTYNHFVVFAQSRGARIVATRGADPFALDIDAIRGAMSASTRMLYLVSPNNPTGVLVPAHEVDRLCRDFPNTLIVLDEAYFEFARQTGIELVQTHRNLIVTRTFSKAFGLAGLRVGYLAAHPSILEGLSRLYNPKSVNTLAQIGAIAALDDLGYLERFLDEVDRAKGLLSDFFAQREVEAHVTPANFVVVRVPDIHHTLHELEARGVYVRDRSSYPGLAGCLRMTVGTVEQTTRLLERLEEVF